MDEIRIHHKQSLKRRCCYLAFRHLNIPIRTIEEIEIVIFYESLLHLVNSPLLGFKITHKRLMLAIKVCQVMVKWMAFSAGQVQFVADGQ